MALKEGWLWKEGHGSMGKQSWRRRWFILESGTLEYFESPESVSRLGQVLLEVAGLRRAQRQHVHT